MTRADPAPGETGHGASATGDSLLHIAADWHTRWEDGLDEVEATAFQQWLSESPEHAQAFLDAEEMMRALRALPAQDKVRLQALSAEPAGPSTARPAPRWRLLHTGAAMALAGLLAVGAGWQLWLQTALFSDSYVTARGQRLDKTLPDSSSLALDADSGAEVRLYRDRREVRLTHGQAMFSISPDAQRPFIVLAGPARISVVGTRFSVRYLRTGADAGSVSVAVEQGQVRVSGADMPSGGFRELSAGQATAVFPDGGMGEIATVPASGVASWRKGMIHFANVPLADALSELERYGPTGLVIHDPAVAALPVGGSYRTGQPAHFARLLPQVLPVRLVALPDGRNEIVRTP